LRLLPQKQGVLFWRLAPRMTRFVFAASAAKTVFSSFAAQAANNIGYFCGASRK
jgi:hypothetical protein